MQIQINTANISHSDAVAARVEQEVNNALKHVADRVTRVEVHLQDTNSQHKSGTDKRCTMEARIAGHQPLAVEHLADDLYDAITAAAGKLERAVTRRLDRLADKRS